MSDVVCEDFLPRALPTKWARIVGKPGMQALGAIGRALDSQPAEKALLTPTPERILRAFELPPENVKVIIVGQDPYPGEGHASGLAFSPHRGLKTLPPSLRNIARELHDDVAITVPPDGDLSPWVSQGVLLLNRHLTTLVGQTGAHRHLGWKAFTDSVIGGLVRSGSHCGALLWGREAQQLTPLMGPNPIVASAHPSPLSAHRGFLGSRPFSRINDYRVRAGQEKIDWSLEDKH